MGIMNRMRENTPIVLWILVIAFGGIWVLQDSGVFDTKSQARYDNVAIVDGEPISYQEYTRAIESQRQQYQAQTGQSMPPQLYDLYRDQIFDAMVDDILRRREMQRLGVVVSDAEVVDMVLGDNPDPLIKQQFGNGNGEVDRDLLRSLIDNPDVREDWIRVEEYLRSKRRAEKFDKLIESTVRVSDAEVDAEYVKRNRKVDAQYVALRYAEIPDDSVSVTERELGAFYNQHRQDYHRDRTINLEYVRFSKSASVGDTTAIVDELTRLRPSFETADDSVFLAVNGSEKAYTDAYFRLDELDAEIADAIADNLEPGKVIGPVIVRNQAHLVKIGAVRPADDASVHARHILIAARSGDAPATKAEGLAKANDLKAQLAQGADFAELAKEFSQDPGSGAKGGDLGWFGPGRMVEPFEKAAAAAQTGQVVGPIETQFGYHLIEVLGRSKKEVQLADLVLTIRPSLDTIGNAEDAAADLGYFAQESGDFAAEVAKHEDLKLETVQVQKDMDVIPGLGASGNVKKFLASAKIGDVSSVIELNDDFVVLHVSDITPEGYRPFDEVRSEVEPQARLEKKKAIQASRLQAAATASSMDLEAMADALGTIRRTASAVNQNNTLVPSLGREPKFVGAALGLAEGATTPVIEGANAAYVLTVTRVYAADPSTLTAAQRASLQSDVLNRKKQRMTSRWLTELRDEADVSDFRYRF